MKWKLLFAVLLGLLMVGVTAGSAMATPSIPRDIEPQSVTPGAALEAYLTGNGIQNSRIIHLIFFAYKHYKVEHGSKLSMVIGIGKLPIGGYRVWIGTPSGVTVYPNEVDWMWNEARYEGTTKKWGKTFHKFKIENSGWTMSSFKVPMKFSKGKGESYGILILGANTYDEIDTFLGNLGGTLLGRLLAGSIGGIIGLLGASGISYDYIKVTEV
ncbi:hypothetical protein GBV73_00470 [Thermococcus sp. 101 C5]|uniref:hypothetical protein n=2 Tax=unclassified Thermococcus TaxID=2627626 RepID=UPI00128B37D6|nr:hypothetical protein [Thermococcus sp. 101 C5]MPW38192.1 hypothetical protein [Thermococcus sp. 101 C5]